jgi:hypothetical protein
MNLLHDIASGTRDVMNVIVEIPKFSKNKYEIDKETGIIAHRLSSMMVTRLMWYSSPPTRSLLASSSRLAQSLSWR